MTSKEFSKCINNYRKIVGSQFGYKKSGYVSYKIVNGYFFYIQHLVDASVDLIVKPFYADDLWWDIFQMPENKKPLSLRGNGAFALPGEHIGEFQTFVGNWKNFTEQDLDKIWTSVFNKIEVEIEKFISKNPSADLYMPPATNARGDVSLTYLIALLHNNKIHEVIELIYKARKNGECCGMTRWIDDKELDGYSYILNYANSIQ